MTLLSLQGLTVRRSGWVVVDGIDLEVGEGELVGLIGPNGAGKTTLMRAALGLLPSEGTSSLAAMPAEARARRAAWMPQSREVAWPVSVEMLVTFGRLTGGEASQAAVASALARMELQDLRHRPATELSGGERTRALIARALAQDTPLLLADEPVAGLDPAHGIATMRVFAELAAEGRAVVVSLHDLGLALRHCSRLLLLDRGRLTADGTPRAVLDPANLARVFGITAHLADTPNGPVFQVLDTLT